MQKQTAAAVLNSKMRNNMQKGYELVEEEEDKLRDECGVVGVFLNPVQPQSQEAGSSEHEYEAYSAADFNAATQAYYALYSLQNRPPVTVVGHRRQCFFGKRPAYSFTVKTWRCCCSTQRSACKLRAAP